MEKLREEINKATDAYAKAVGNYVFSLGIIAVPKGKTLEGCMAAIQEKAKKQMHKGVAVIEHPTVYSWAREYFGLAPDAPMKETPKPQTSAISQAAPLALDFEDLMG